MEALRGLVFGVIPRSTDFGAGGAGPRIFTSGDAIASNYISTTYMRPFGPIAKIDSEAVKSARRPPRSSFPRKIGPQNPV